MKEKKYKKHKMLEKDYLTVDDKNRVYYSVSGNKNGIPVIYAHGGPGGMTTPRSLQFFNPKKYKVILFDQRGCGNSLPCCSTYNNKIDYLVEDIEMLRKHLGLDKIILFGGSFGSTLSLAYAIKYPQNCLCLIISGIFLARQEDVDWLYKDGAKQFFPDEFEKYYSVLDKKEDPITEYYNIFNSDSCDENTKEKAFKTFANLEASLACLKTKGIDFGKTPFRFVKQIAFLENYYFYNKTFKEDNYILDNVDKIKDIKTIIVHGRYDMICRPISAYLLHKKLPLSELHYINFSGHSFFEKDTFAKLVDILDNLKI